MEYKNTLPNIVFEVYHHRFRITINSTMKSNIYELTKEEKQIVRDDQRGVESNRSRSGSDFSCVLFMRRICKTTLDFFMNYK